MRRPGGIALVELAALVWSFTAAASEPTPIRIEFDQPAACSTPQEFYQAIRGRNDRVRLASEGERAFGIRVRLAQSGANVHGELRVVHEQGETSTRTVDGASCEVVVDALSLTATLALDAVVAEGARAAEAAPPAAETPPAEPKPNPDAAAAPKADDDEQSRSATPPRKPVALGLQLGLSAMVTQLVSPYVDVGGGVTFRIELDSGETLSPQFGITVFHVRNDVVTSPEPASVQATAGLLTACPWRLGLGSVVSLRPCALGAAGQLSAEGDGLLEPRSVSRSWWSAGAILRASAALGVGVALEAEAGGAAALVERRFVITPSGRSAGETPIISPLASLGIIYTF